MGERGRRTSGSMAREEEEHKERLSARAVWGRTGLGLVMGVGGGTAFGHAWAKSYALSWWIGSLSVLAGVLLVLSTVRASSRAAREAQEEGLGVRPGQLWGEREPLVPLLGALLVYKYQALTQEQLARALEEQLREDRRSRRLGEILLEMQMVTESQLAEALDHQRLYVWPRNVVALKRSRSGKRDSQG